MLFFSFLSLLSASHYDDPYPIGPFIPEVLRDAEIGRGVHILNSWRFRFAIPLWMHAGVVDVIFPTPNFAPSDLREVYPLLMLPTLPATWDLTCFGDIPREHLIDAPKELVPEDLQKAVIKAHAEKRGFDYAAMAREYGLMQVLCMLEDMVPNFTNTGLVEFEGFAPLESQLDQFAKQLYGGTERKRNSFFYLVAQTSNDGDELLGRLGLLEHLLHNHHRLQLYLGSLNPAAQDSSSKDEACISQISNLIPEVEPFERVVTEKNTALREQIALAQQQGDFDRERMLKRENEMETAIHNTAMGASENFINIWTLLHFYEGSHKNGRDCKNRLLTPIFNVMSGDFDANEYCAFAATSMMSLWFLGFMDEPGIFTTSLIPAYGSCKQFNLLKAPRVREKAAEIANRLLDEIKTLRPGQYWPMMHLLFEILPSAIADDVQLTAYLQRMLAEPSGASAYLLRLYSGPKAPISTVFLAEKPFVKQHLSVVLRNRILKQVPNAQLKSLLVTHQVHGTVANLQLASSPAEWEAEAAALLQTQDNLSVIYGLVSISTTDQIISILSLFEDLVDTKAKQDVTSVYTLLFKTVPDRLKQLADPAWESRFKLVAYRVVGKSTALRKHIEDLRDASPLALETAHPHRLSDAGSSSALQRKQENTERQKHARHEEVFKKRHQD